MAEGGISAELARIHPPVERSKLRQGVQKTLEKISGLKSEFEPAQLNLDKLVEKISQLENGDVLHLVNNMEIIRLGNKNILLDPAILGFEYKLEKNKIIPPGTKSQDAYKSERNEDDYHYRAIDAPPNGPEDTSSQVSRIGKALAPHIDTMLISHLHGDHIDFELIRTILENNPKADVYGPLGWKKFVLRHHDREGKPVTGKSLIPDYLIEKIKSLTPRKANGKRSLGEFYIPSEVLLDNKVKITSIDVPHLGGQEAVDMTQGFLMEADKQRILFISDAALSPEIILHIKQLHEQKKLTHILISGAVYNPETMYAVLRPKTADTIRDFLEEGIGHSAYLPLLAASLTNGEVPVTITHHGFYHRSSSDRKYLNYRLPAQTENIESSQSWSDRFNSHIDQMLKRDAGKIDRLHRLALVSKHNKGKFFSELYFRINFARELVKWIKKEKVPQGVIDQLGMPQSGETIKEVVRPEYPQQITPVSRLAESVQPVR